jgi:hypothetical protein
VKLVNEAIELSLRNFIIYYMMETCNSFLIHFAAAVVAHFSSIFKIKIILQSNNGAFITVQKNLQFTCCVVTIKNKFVRKMIYVLKL